MRSGQTDRELDVGVPTGATLAELARAAGLVPSPDGCVLVGGRRLPGTCPVAMSGLAPGVVIGVEGGPFVPPAVAVAHEVVAAAGLDAGGSWPLADHVLVGRGVGAGVRLAQPAISREHCTLTLVGAGGLRVHDAGARNPVVVDERALRPGEAVEVDLGAAVRLGPVELLVRPRPPADRPFGLAEHGVLPVNRPPRAGPARPAAPLPLPQEPTAQPREPFAVAALVGPLLLAAVMVGVTGDPRFALFSALSPVLAVGSWWESRRRGSRSARREQARYRRELRALGDSCRAAGSTERDRLRALVPDPAEVLRRAALPSTRLWERRPDAPDFLLLPVGTADQPWAPPVTPGTVPPAVREVLATSRLVAAPVTVDLAGGVVGIVGDRPAALAVARSLLCAATVGAGPADLTVAVLVDPGREGDWDWCTWLPHTRDTSGEADRWLSAEPRSSGRLLSSLSAGAASGTALLVLDTAVLTGGRDAAARELLARARSPGGPRLAGIVVAPTEDALPAACDQVLVVDQDGAATLTRLVDGTRTDGVLVAGLSVARARQCARDLARLEDPETAAAGAGLPTVVRLLPLLGLEVVGGAVDPAAIRERWRAAGPDPGALAPLGVCDSGTFVLDLVRDGAHGLIAGTTGAGKSELLRSLVAALAVHTDADHLVLVLIDYKGGAAFDACARLPHVVGLVTDLDEQLGARALRALEAELAYRERTLRAAGVDTLAGYLCLGLPEALPRLVVVVDEFATLAKELPDVVTSLVGIAQRGRTLGVHLLLATQRPTGVVRDDIRANTNLRIALRVQDDADSRDVVGTLDAARISRNRPGRAYVRLGPGEVVGVQTALVTCVSGGDLSVDAAPLVFGPRHRAPIGGPRGVDAPAVDTGRTDLALLVDAVVAAHDAAGLGAPRRPWPEPLPATVDLTALPAGGASGVAVVALSDDPAHQRQEPAGWDLDEGGLLLLGVPGSGTTTALLALALVLAARWGPAELELHALDFGIGALQALEVLPQTGAVVLAHDRERQARLLRRLRGELNARRDGSGPPVDRPRIVLLVDELAAMRAAYDDVDGLELLDVLARLHADGPAVGLCVAITADRPAAVPAAISAVTTQRWLFRLADPADHASAGLARADVPAALPGRAVLLPSRLQAQVGLPGPHLPAQVAARWVAEPRRVRPVGRLPTRLGPGELGTSALQAGGCLRLPVGLAEADLAVATLSLHDGDAGLVAGPARSGRSGVLGSLAQLLAAGGVHVLGVSTPRSPLARCAALAAWAPPSQAGATAARLLAAGAPAVLLVDDAESVEDPDGALESMVCSEVPGLHLVAAGRSDALRVLYGHWTSRVRRCRTGLLLRPHVDLDGDLLAVTLPRRAPVALGPGRGYLVQDGEAALVQAATSTGP